jgi:NAD(P)H-hydrate epimerase
LLNIKTAQIQNDRYCAAKALTALTSGATAILKGAFSIVQGAGCGFVNSTGNRYMATAGSGDVLSGIVASYIAQGLDPLEAAKRGAFVHGLAGDLAHQNTMGAIIASDLLEYVGQSENIIYEANNGQ